MIKLCDILLRIKKGIILIYDYETGEVLKRMQGNDTDSINELYKTAEVVRLEAVNDTIRIGIIL